MKTLSLRLRIFLFFCLIGFGGISIVLVALWLGFRQLADPAVISPFLSVAIVSGFGILGLTTFVWFQFDKNISKPIEGLAAQFRICANAGVLADIDVNMARYLADLAPAAFALQRKLGAMINATEATVAQRTELLEAQRDQLLRILSDIPVAVIVATQEHQIVLYDGQAADLMEREAPARLNGSVYDYLENETLNDVLSKMESDQKDCRKITIKGKSGIVYSGHIRLFDENTGYTLILEPLDPNAARPLVYDFDLLDKPRETDPNECPLRNLTFVVFDCETTGLNTEKDEVVQLGAVRIVNGKIIAAEVFDTLVNPGIPIPRNSSKVHGISNEMVENAPPFAEVRTAFHAFARNAVLIAHNAPFDMAFLRRDAKHMDLQFDNPIIDTVHLSAIVFGGSVEHTLDALCDRLDIHIPPDLRHTAMGDARATAEAFVAMLPILEARGLQTFGQVRNEMKKHSRILKVQT